jgi:hypothetical protein
MPLIPCARTDLKAFPLITILLLSKTIGLHVQRGVKLENERVQSI